MTMTRTSRTRRSIAGKIVICSTVALLAAGPGRAATQPMTTGFSAGQHQASQPTHTKGDPNEDTRRLKLALQRNPLDASSHFELGCLLAQQGEDNQAMVGFHRTLALDPTHPEALHNLGTMLLRRGEAIPAARLLENAVAIRPDYVPSYNSLAKAYYAAGIPELAVATYGEAVRRDPSNSVARENLSLLARAAGIDLAAAEKESDEEKQKKASGQEPWLGDGGPPLPDTVPADPLSPEAAPADPLSPKTGGDKKKKDEPAAKKKGGAAAAKESGESDAGLVAELLRELPNVKVHRRAGRIVLTGWTSGPREKEMLDKVLAVAPKVLDLTGPDVGDPQRMLEVDAVLFVVIGVEQMNAGFNFLDLIQMNFSYFRSDHDREGSGLTGPGTFGDVAGAAKPAAESMAKTVGDLAQQGWLFLASVDYSVNIANAADERVAVLAQPHLTTLSGTPASFLSGGEFVFKVSGINSGDIKPYPFGTHLVVTPTLLRSPGVDGSPRVHLNVNAGRTSILELLAAQELDESVVFDKVTVNSQAVLDLGQTLILSGLNQRETRSGVSGFPGLRSIPVLKYLFSTTTHLEVNTTVIILLTPRDPAFMDEQNRKSLTEFVEKRRAFVQARQGTGEDMRRFQERYPDWDRIAPNRFASHFFMMNTSELYRNVSGEDLAGEDLDFNLLGGKPKKKEKRKEADTDPFDYR